MLPKHMLPKCSSASGPLGLGPLPLHGFGHLPPGALAGLPGAAAAAAMGIHPTPLSALTAAARSPTAGGAGLPGIGPGPGGPLGGPIRRRISDKLPLPLTNGTHD